jgi:Asp-tRNA(Asn)/Glu-tRNA(Gln) amidotransferase A subunit family amidase
VSAVRERRVSATELVKESLGRIERAADLNAVVRTRAEEALAEARALDAAIAGGREVGPLAGLPLLVKDIEDVAGMTTTYGSLLHRDDRPARRDALTPRRLRAAGAIVVGKTNVPEFAFEGYSANRLFGATVDPWAPALSPGGSSGGSGAALAAGLVPLATATDGGGSVRIPAACCGLAGLKPTNGIVARDPIPTWSDLSTDGPLSVTVADLGLLLDLMAGPIEGDPTAQVGWRREEHADRRPGHVVAAARLVGSGPVDDEVATLFRSALAAVETGLSMPVEELAAGAVFDSTTPDDDWFTIAAVESLHELGRSTVERALTAGSFEAGFARWMTAALQIDLETYLDARRRRFDYVRRLDELLGGDGLLLSPTLTVAGWTPEGVVPGRESEAPGLPLDVLNTSIVNLGGHPALSLPAGRHANGLPFGLQVVGPRYRDGLVLAFGERWERARPWPIAAPGYEPFPTG